MIDENKYSQAVDHYTQNPYWNKIYEDAPTLKSKRYEGLTFYFSEFADEMLSHGEMYRGYKEEKDRLENEMGLGDWLYLYRHAGNNPFKEKCREKAEQLKEQQSTKES